MAVMYHFVFVLVFLKHKYYTIFILFKAMT